MLSLLRVYKQNAFVNYGLFATLNNKLSRKIPYATSIVKHVLHYVDLHNENEVWLCDVMGWTRSFLCDESRLQPSIKTDI